MLDRQGGKIIFECDVCGETFDTDERDFVEAKGKFDEEGWRARKIGSDWVHNCPDCTE
jgi:hypothetical protein